MKKIIKYVFIASFVLYLILPILTNLIISFSNVWQWPNILPENFTTNHYKVVISNVSFWKALITTFIVAVSVVFLNYIIAMPAAYVLSRGNYKHKNLLIGFILMPIILPPLLVLMNLYFTFLRFGLTDRFIGVIIAHMIPSLPYMFLILYLGFEKIDKNYEIEMTSLGIPPIRGFFKIILPQVKTSVLLGGVLSFLISIGQYLSTLFIGGGRIITLNLMLTPYINGGNAKVGAANAIFLILFCFVFILLYEQLLIGGQHAKN